MESSHSNPGSRRGFLKQLGAAGLTAAARGKALSSASHLAGAETLSGTSSTPRENGGRPRLGYSPLLRPRWHLT